MTSIGRRCRHGDVHSRAILIAQTLSRGDNPHQKTVKKRASIAGGADDARSERTVAAMPAGRPAGFQVVSVREAGQLSSAFLSPYTVAAVTARHTKQLRW